MNNQQKKVIYVFDMDDTLVKTPKLEEVIKIVDGKSQSGIPSVDDRLNAVVKIINELYKNNSRLRKLANIDNEFYLKKQNEKICLNNDNLSGKEIFDFIDNNEQLSKKEKNAIFDKFEFDGDCMRLHKFGEYYRTEGTIGVELIKPTIDVYNKAINKMIVTGRSNSIRKGAEYILFNYLGLDYPNYGFYLYDFNKNGIPAFKANIIINSIQKNNWDIVNMFEDKDDWLVIIKNIIKTKFPKIIFNSYLVSKKY